MTVGVNAVHDGVFDRLKGSLRRSDSGKPTKLLEIRVIGVGSDAMETEIQESNDRRGEQPETQKRVSPS